MITWHWHHRHLRESSVGEIVADRVAAFIGSWTFFASQTAIFAAWIVWNASKGEAFDPYPFILFNLVMSAEAAYSSPLILMSQNRQSERDRLHAQHDYEVNLAAKQEIETLQLELARIEDEKLDRILALLVDLKCRAPPAESSDKDR